jgi:hypothetical protein
LSFIFFCPRMELIDTKNKFLLRFPADFVFFDLTVSPVNLIVRTIVGLGMKLDISRITFTACSLLVCPLLRGQYPSWAMYRDRFAQFKINICSWIYSKRNGWLISKAPITRSPPFYAFRLFTLYSLFSLFNSTFFIRCTITFFIRNTPVYLFFIECSCCNLSHYKTVFQRVPDSYIHPILSLLYCPIGRFAE